jgi:hypothetical protein
MRGFLPVARAPGSRQTTTPSGTLLGFFNANREMIPQGIEPKAGEVGRKRSVELESEGVNTAT